MIKLKQKEKRLFIFAFQQMRISIGERRRKKMFFFIYFYFLQRLITRKAYQKNFYKTVIIHHLKVKRVSKSDTLYLKLFSIQDICCIRQFTPLVQQFFFFISEIFLPRKTFFFFIFSNYKSLELNLKNKEGKCQGVHECSPTKSCYYRILVTHSHWSMWEYEKDIC